MSDKIDIADLSDTKGFLANILSTIEDGTKEEPLGFPTFKQPPFPVECFSAKMQEFLRHVSELSGAPLDVPAVQYLSALSTIRTGIYFCAFNGKEIACNLFSIISISSGAGKSSSFEEIMRPLDTWVFNQAESLKFAVEENRSQRRVLKAQLARLEGKGSRDPTTDIERQDVINQLKHLPRLYYPELYIKNTTSEKLEKLLLRHDRMAVLSPEGSSILDIILGKKYNSREDTQTYLSMYSGESPKVSRIKDTEEDEEERIFAAPHPRYGTVGLSVQPSVLKDLLTRSTLKENGFLARFQLCAPKFIDPWRIPGSNPVSRDMRLFEEYTKNTLRELSSNYDQLQSAKKVVFSLSNPSVVLLEDYCVELIGSLKDAAEQDEFWVNYYNRASHLPIKLATLLFTDGKDQQEIPHGIVKAAIVASKYFHTHMLECFSFGEETVLDDKANKLLNMMKSKRDKKDFTCRDIQRALQTVFRRRKDVEEAITLLREKGFVTVSAGDVLDNRSPPVYLTSAVFSLKRQK